MRKKDGKRYFYYSYASRREGNLSCANRKTHRAERIEPAVWDLASALLTDPERLRAGLDEITERERTNFQRSLRLRTPDHKYRRVGIALVVWSGTHNLGSGLVILDVGTSRGGLLGPHLSGVLGRCICGGTLDCGWLWYVPSGGTTDRAASKSAVGDLRRKKHARKFNFLELRTRAVRRICTPRTLVNNGM